MPIPPVSVSKNRLFSIVTGVVIRSLVVPDSSAITATFLPARRLKSVDFPTLGLPTIATIGVFILLISII